jgi:hypothetical protein
VRWGLSRGVSCEVGEKRTQFWRKLLAFEPTYSEGEALEDLESRLGGDLILSLESLSEHVDNSGDERLESSLLEIFGSALVSSLLFKSVLLTISAVSLCSMNSESFPSALTVHTRTPRLSGSARVLLNSSRSWGMWLAIDPPGLEGVTTRVSRSMKMV